MGTPHEIPQARVAVIIPCFRDGELAAEALGSIHEYEPVEIVIVDDASDDAATQSVLKLLETRGVHVIRHERNLGLPAARGTGLAATTAPYVFPLDADDLAVPYVLGPMADRLDEDPNAAVCFGDYAEFGVADQLRAVPARIDPYRISYVNEYPVSALFRRDVLEAVGGWDQIEAYEDWHLWMTLAERGMKGVHFGFGVVTYRRRVHGTRMLTRARRGHRSLYMRLRADHPRLFQTLPESRRRSSLSPFRKALYPYLYGSRPRFSWEPKVKNFLYRTGIWTVQR
jgi:glycosyltransferase involved in cell wall biosynthesis